MFVSSRSWPISGGFSLVAPLRLAWSVALSNPLVMHHSLTWDDWPRSPILSLLESDFRYGILRARKGRVEYERGFVGVEYVSESKRTLGCSGGNEEDDGFDVGPARCDALRERPGYASHGRSFVVWRQSIGHQSQILRYSCVTSAYVFGVLLVSY